MTRYHRATQLRRALQLFAATVTDESVMMEIADVYPRYAVGKAYKTGDVFSHGVNPDGETQLWKVLQGHVSAAEWPPAASPSLYKKIGYAENGLPIWTQPLIPSEAYNKGDIVMHKGKKWKSDIDANVWEPGVAGWTEIIT